ncbi:MAG: hypothetical protein QM599_00260 [Pseudoxanthomonas sp.]
MRVWFVAAVLTFANLPAFAAEDYWVTTDRLDRKTCPSVSCGVAGQLMFREHAGVLEIKNGWGRISKYYDASCVAGRSQYVKQGNAACTPANGMNKGQFVEWVSMKSLSKTRPVAPGADATGIAALIKDSDDYKLRKDAFVKATQTLLSRKKCTEKDFKESGGWYKSTNHRSQPVYFIYCSGFTSNNKIYLDASTGRIFK